ncbi:MAG: hypothetical protein D3908_14955, partial [Candidatus Electrothrix sp. AUS4]|nr:hypothetical protein [Candidatus Electrothrix sp. AUS4]
MNRPSLYGIFVFIIGLFSLLITSPVNAHKLNIFSWAGDNQIYGEAFFSGGRKAKNITIQIQDAKSDALLLSTQTDEEGKFQFAPPKEAIKQKADLRIVANSGDGHRGEWLLTADEYLLSEASASSTGEKSQAKEDASDGENVRETVREIVRQELARELAPIR